MKKIFITVFMTILAFAACSNDDEVNSPREEVKIVATIGSTANSKLKATFENDGSGEFETGDILYLNCSGPNSIVPVEYEIGNTTLYWDEISADGSPLNISAWYPAYYASDQEEPYLIAGQDYNTQDLLMAPAVPVDRGDIVNLQFRHVMHKLVIRLSSDYYTEEELGEAVITLKNLKSHAMVDFDNGTVIAAEASGTDPYTISNGALAEIIVAPQVLSPGTGFIEIFLPAADRTFTYKVPEGLTELESGKTLTLNFELINTAPLRFAPVNIEAKSVRVEAWDNEGIYSRRVVTNRNERTKN